MWRRPSVATPGLIGRTLALDFALMGATTVVSTFLPAESGHRHTWLLRLLGLAAVLSAPAFLRLRRLDWWLMNSITTSGTLTITLGLYLTGGGTTAAVCSTFYLVVVVHVFYAYARPLAWLHVAFAASMCLLVLRGDHAVGASELMILLGVAVSSAVLVGWLVRAADLAEVDFLTGLSNRRGFESAAEALLRGRAGHHQLALVLIDLDDFRSINERYGHAGGDNLLLALARYWTSVVPAEAVLARHGGDEFVLLLPDADPERLEQVITAMRAAPQVTTFSAGLAFSTRGESVSMLLSRADSAVYEAKRAGRARTVVAAQPADLQTGDDITSALLRGDFVLFYQPIIDLNTGVVDKAEALVRWIHPERGLIPPSEFIHRAEQTGTITALGDWIVATACDAAVTWLPNADGEPINLSVNASGLELRDPTYAARVHAHLNRTGLDPARLVIELVETDYNANSPAVAGNLTQLADFGVQLAIDDFGTGYSNLNRLNQTHVQILKIDRSFITPICDRDQVVPLVTAILAMAAALNLDVIAEGVETAEQSAWLRTHGVTHAQGYLYGKPAPQPPNQPATGATDTALPGY
jgi:diguanylate cyclase (GGDEF)-like protein